MATATTTSAPTSITVTEGQNTLLRSFIDQVNAFKFSNPGKQIKTLALSYDKATGSYTVALEEEAVTTGTTPQTPA